MQKGSGTTLVVRYQDGALTISVPANVPVSEVKPEQVALGAGNTVYLTTDKLPNGTLSFCSSARMCSGRAKKALPLAIGTVEMIRKYMRPIPA